MKSRDNRAYALAGVDIKAADRAKELIRRHARSTSRPEVLTDIGSFGGILNSQATIKMYRVFNMGIGMTIICSAQQVAELTTALPEANIIGKVIPAKENEGVIAY